MKADPLSELVVKPIQKAALEDLILLYKDAGWWKSSYDKAPEFLEYIVKDSALFVGAFWGEKFVGMGRALSDLVSDAYIQDVAVLKEYRGRGIGKRIIEKLIDGLKENGVDWIGLIAEPGTTPFYKELGFDILDDHVPLKYKDS